MINTEAVLAVWSPCLSNKTVNASESELVTQPGLVGAVVGIALGAVTPPVW